MTTHDFRNVLSNEILDQIESLSELGNEAYEKDHYLQAIDIWQQALSLIPDPQHHVAESQWLAASIGDSYFLLEKFRKSLTYFQLAKSNIEENAYENPFIMLRLGQSYLENHQPEEAREYLLRAYMLEGKEIFEFDDPKYLVFLSHQVDLDPQ